MVSPALHTTNKPQNDVFSGSSSSSVDLDVVEIPPPMNWSSKSKLRGKEVAHHGVINVDPDDDIILIDEKDFSYKSKKSTNSSNSNAVMHKTTDAVQSSKNTIVQGAYDFSGIGFADLDFMDEATYKSLFEDCSVVNGDFRFLQTQLDSVDIPTGIKAPKSWSSEPVNKTNTVGSFFASNYLFSHAQSSWISPSSSSWQNPVSTKHPHGTSHSSFSALPKPSPNTNKWNSSTMSQNWCSKVATGTSSLLSSVPSYLPDFPISKRKDVPGTPWNSYSKRFHPYNLQNKTPEEDGFTWYSGGKKIKPVEMDDSSFYQPHVAEFVHLSPEWGFKPEWDLIPLESLVEPSGSVTTSDDHRNDDIMNNPQLFKQFDTVEDYSDHHYSRNGSAVTQQPKQWAKRIQEEWKILEKDLPDTIFVRVYESRMDLMRAVIVGAQGTPYHDGLFFFDIFFPSDYPSVPPHVYYHSGGLQINPNLYNCGKVCLSLLNTWDGQGNEKWIPKVSTMLQVLVSIQALILNESPYFNEPGFAGSDKTEYGQMQSQDYSENAFILSLKTMMYTMRKPPKQFGGFVIGYFRKHAQDILDACKVYIEEGVQVGSVTKGGVKNVQENVKKSSPRFKGVVASHITMLVQAFVMIGAKDCDKFLSLAQVASARPQLPSYQPPANPFVYMGPTLNDYMEPTLFDYMGPELGNGYMGPTFGSGYM